MRPWVGYVPLAGTGGAKDGWVFDDDDPFTRYMDAQGFGPIRNGDGAPLFQWDGGLSGLWWQGTRHWRRQVNPLRAALWRIPYRYRILFAHSHAGQFAIMLAAQGFPIRALVTIGTPRRFDVPAVDAVGSIGTWLHLHDNRRDWIATATAPIRRLGGLGDRHWNTKRTFDIPGVQNCPIPKVGHSKLLTDPACFHLWQDMGVLDALREAPGE
jgi:hypothetical protein